MTYLTAEKAEEEEEEGFYFEALSYRNYLNKQLRYSCYLELNDLGFKLTDLYTAPLLDS